MPDDRDAQDVFDVVQKLTCICKPTTSKQKPPTHLPYSLLLPFLASSEQLYAYSFQPRPPYTSTDGWKIYDPVTEFERMGVGKIDTWRLSSINRDYSVSNIGVVGVVQAPVA
jgi:hypothetical protein